MIEGAGAVEAPGVIPHHRHTKEQKPLTLIFRILRNIVLYIITLLRFLPGTYMLIKYT